jgi:hypothetical protein
MPFPFCGCHISSDSKSLYSGQPCKKWPIERSIADCDGGLSASMFGNGAEFRFENQPGFFHGYFFADQMET